MQVYDEGVTPERIFHRQEQKQAVLRELIERLGVGPGDRVLDVGSGPGFTALLAAERVGPGGGVWALDASAEALAYLEARRDERGLGWLRTLTADAGDFALPDPGVNRFLIADMLHHADGPEGIVRHLGAVLPAGARGVVSDYDPFIEARRYGPALDIRIPEAQVRGWLEAAGFAVESAWRPPDEHYAFVVAVPPSGR